MRKRWIMEYHVLASGSKGNSTFIVEKTTGILIDCGISKKQLTYRLKEIGYTIDDIDYVLLTHGIYRKREYSGSR